MKIRMSEDYVYDSFRDMEERYGVTIEDAFPQEVEEEDEQPETEEVE